VPEGSEKKRELKDWSDEGRVKLKKTDPSADNKKIII
jgi:hypothetical protein